MLACTSPDSLRCGLHTGHVVIIYMRSYSKRPKCNGSESGAECSRE